jgi:hypothetical protein
MVTPDTDLRSPEGDPWARNRALEEVNKLAATKKITPKQPAAKAKKEEESADEATKVTRMRRQARVVRMRRSKT